MPPPPPRGYVPDRIYTMGADRICAGTIETDVSDHFPIFASFEDSSVNYNHKEKYDIEVIKTMRKNGFVIVYSWNPWKMYMNVLMLIKHMIYLYNHS